MTWEIKKIICGNQEHYKKAQDKYDEADIERRRKQKRDYMRRKREEDPNYCKWK